jgi:hypothetical protein
LTVRAEMTLRMALAMNNVTIFWLQLLLSLSACAIVATWYVWPYLTKLSRNSALIPLLFVHVMRYVGMTLLVIVATVLWDWIKLNSTAGPAPSYVT